MAQTAIQKVFKPLKDHLPDPVWNFVRSVGTAVIGPIRFAYFSGFWRSAFKCAAVTKSGAPLPWYTYPAIDFIKFRDYQDKLVLEFGGGQSTLWWAKHAKHVVTLEGDEQWYNQIKQGMPSNVSLHNVTMQSAESNVADVNRVLSEHSYSKYDVIVIDGLHRFEMIEVALNYLNEGGAIICDNAEGYNFCEGFKDSGLQRVDFFGNAPGTVLPHCTCIYVAQNSFIMSAENPIPVISNNH